MLQNKNVYASVQWLGKGWKTLRECIYKKHLNTDFLCSAYGKPSLPLYRATNIVMDSSDRIYQNTGQLLSLLKYSDDAVFVH